MSETAIEKPYGSWKSPITTEMIAGKTVKLGGTATDGENIFWLERRPSEAGRCVLVKRTPDGNTEDVNKSPYNICSKVHEYGGKSFCIENGILCFANFADQHLYIMDINTGTEPEAITKEENCRYADMVFDAKRNRIICVQEKHIKSKEPENSIVAININNRKKTTLIEGEDFYAYPRLSPNKDSLVWISWNHPNMPWDGTELFLAEVTPNGIIENKKHIAGGKNEAVFQPEWSPSGVLHFVSDPSGWWNIYKLTPDGITCLLPCEHEFGLPLWQFGMSTYGFTDDEKIICTFFDKGIQKQGIIDNSKLEILDIPFAEISVPKPYKDKMLFTGSTAYEGAGIVLFDAESGTYETLKKSGAFEIDKEYISKAQVIEFPTENGLNAYGFYYSPTNGDYKAPEGEKPPLIVRSHGGPTGATSNCLSLDIQYWTSRGFAIVDVNYGGSTGYGRQYRERLNGKWGITDVEDCVNAALYLAEKGLADRKRLCIRGSSAGGYTTLCALTFKDVFKAGASLYGIGDLKALADDTHKFECRYFDKIIGPLPEASETYEKRSPINYVENLTCPVIFFQGLDDKVVPPNQAEKMVEALKTKKIPVAHITYEGEGHGFRKAENIKQTLEGELYFYSRVLNFETCEKLEKIHIENM